eukprot:scaffold2682_cov344-Pavlova_lutheri.AAC.9
MMRDMRACRNAYPGACMDGIGSIVRLSMSLFDSLCQIHDFLVYPVSKSCARKALVHVLPGQSTHVGCSGRIGRERVHCLRKRGWTGLHKKACLLMQNTFHRSPAVACDDRLGSGHCFQRDDSKVFELGSVKDRCAAAEQCVLGCV